MEQNQQQNQQQVISPSSSPSSPTKNPSPVSVQAVSNIISNNTNAAAKTITIRNNTSYNASNLECDKPQKRKNDNMQSEIQVKEEYDDDEEASTSPKKRSKITSKIDSKYSNGKEIEKNNNLPQQLIDEYQDVIREKVTCFYVIMKEA